MNRRHFLLCSGSLLALPLLGTEVLAEIGGSVPPPLEVLPGPYGFLGTGVRLDADEEEEEDTSKADMEQLAEDLKDTGTVGGLLGGGIAGFGGLIGSGAGWTGVGLFVGGGLAAFGSGMMVGAGIAYGAGAIVGRIADDPPRYDYKRNPDCKILTADLFSEFQNLPKTTRNWLDASFLHYAASANTLAALEFWQGAHAKNDSKWRKIHRANFVKHWNQMKKSIETLSRTLEPALETARKEYRKAGYPQKFSSQTYQKMLPALRKDASSLSRAFISQAKKHGLTELEFLDGAMVKTLPKSWSSPPSKSEVKKMAKDILRVSRALPSYR